MYKQQLGEEEQRACPVLEVLAFPLSMERRQAEKGVVINQM